MPPAGGRYMSEASPRTSADSVTIPTEAVWAVDSTPRITIGGPRARADPGLLLLARFDPEVDPAAVERGLDPIGELQRLGHRCRAGPVVDEIVAGAVRPEPQVLQQVGDMGERRALAVELEEQ